MDASGLDVTNFSTPITIYRCLEHVAMIFV